MSEYTLKDLNKEIAKIAQEMSRPLPKAWLVNAVISTHSDIEGEDKDMALCCVYDTVRRGVDTYFRSFKHQTDELNQLSFKGEGFTHLQIQYVFPRNGESVVDYIWNMSIEELQAKEQEHRVMGQGHFDHADEIARYIQKKLENEKQA